MIKTKYLGNTAMRQNLFGSTEGEVPACCLGPDSGAPEGYSTPVSDGHVAVGHTASEEKPSAPASCRACGKEEN